MSLSGAVVTTISTEELGVITMITSALSALHSETIRYSMTVVQTGFQ